MCDHTVMISCMYYERDMLIKLSEVSSLCKDASEYSKERAKASEFYMSAEPKDYINGRKGYSTLFKFCPFCGEKIDWKKIRASV